MNKKCRKGFIKTALSLGITVAFLLSTTFSAFAAVGVNVNTPTQEEIRTRFEKIYKENDFKVKYDVAPNLKGPAYVPGKLSEETLKGAVDLLNGLRFIAGVPDDVKLKQEYAELCQAGALVNAVNQEMSHHPEKPADMSAQLYQLGAKGCGSSNLFWNVDDFEEAVEGWVSDEYNVSTDPGHRRWCLNPAMQYTGFGKVGAYSAMYAFDRFGASDCSGIAWPAQQMPTDFFNPNIQWSISFGRVLEPASIEVMLKRSSDGKTWNFNGQKANGQFFVSNVNYGKPGCVVFRPSNITAYKNGDQYHVTVKENGNVIADYDVNFFSLTKTPAKVKLSSLTTGKTHYVKASWKKVDCDGYQVRYSTSKSFKSYKTVTVKNEKTLSKTISKLKKGKNYYVKVRAYNQGHKGKAYGGFSTVKKITCK